MRDHSNGLVFKDRYSNGHLKKKKEEEGGGEKEEKKMMARRKIHSRSTCSIRILMKRKISNIFPYHLSICSSLAMLEESAIINNQSFRNEDHDSSVIPGDSLFEYALLTSIEKKVCSVFGSKK